MRKVFLFVAALLLSIGTCSQTAARRVGGEAPFEVRRSVLFADETLDEFITSELCLKAVNDYWKNLKFVPDRLKTTELCLLAVQQNNSALEYVPEELKENLSNLKAD